MILLSEISFLCVNTIILKTLNRYNNIYTPNSRGKGEVKVKFFIFQKLNTSC